MDLALLLGIALLIGLFFGLRRYSVKGRSRMGRPAPSIPASLVRSQTKRELLRLVGGNQALAKRLVEEVQQRHPDHGEQWCWEKAIYDLQRDRRST